MTGFQPCNDAGLQPARLRVPMVDEAAACTRVWHHDLGCTQTACGGWTELLGPIGQTTRDLPPVPDFLEPFTRDAPGMQGAHQPSHA